MKAVIDDLASNKSPGLDGLSAEHFKFAHSRLLALMSTLVSSIVVHGHVPHNMNESVIVPIIKDKNKRVNDKNNYRPICLSNICSKIIEVVIFNIIGTFLSSRKMRVLGHFTIHMVQLYTDQPHVWLEHGHHPCSSHTCGWTQSRFH